MYADVFSASMVCSKSNNEILKLNFDDNRVDYVEVSHSLTTDTNNINPEIGEHENQFESLHTECNHSLKSICYMWTSECRFFFKSG